SSSHSVLPVPSQYAHHSDLHSFPTRRSSDLSHHHAHLGIRCHARRADGVGVELHELAEATRPRLLVAEDPAGAVAAIGLRKALEDRKSTRLNSSHVKISYAVFCLKKKTRNTR